MTVVQPGKQHFSCELDDFRPLGHVFFNARLVADIDDSSAFDGHGLGAWSLGVRRMHDSVLEDQIRAAGRTTYRSPAE